MTGTTYKRKNGTWCYQIPLGKDETGKRRKETKGGYKTKREAEAAKTEALAELQRIDPSARLPRSLRDYLDSWLKNHAERNCERSTVDRYRRLLDHIHKDVMETPIQELTPLQLEREFYRIKDCGGHHRKTKKARPVSAKTVKHVAALIGSALSDAVRLQQLRRNPVAVCKLPPVEQKEKAVLDPQQLALVLDLAKGTRLENFLAVAAGTGLRRGELLALTVDDFDAERRILKIAKSLGQSGTEVYIKRPKNNKARLVWLPMETVQAIERELEEREKDRAMMGAAYNDQRLIFADVHGNYLKPDTMTTEVCRYLKKWGFQDISLHSFRHTHGSNLLSTGVPLPTVSKRLGHSSPRITAEIYSHALPSDEIAAADAWDRLMQPKKPSTKRPH